MCANGVRPVKLPRCRRLLGQAPCLPLTSAPLATRPRLCRLSRPGLLAVRHAAWGGCRRRKPGSLSTPRETSRAPCWAVTRPEGTRSVPETPSLSQHTPSQDTCVSGLSRPCLWGECDGACAVPDACWKAIDRLEGVCRERLARPARPTKPPPQRSIAITPAVQCKTFSWKCSAVRVLLTSSSVGLSTPTSILIYCV